MFYLDTSAFVPLYAPEAKSADVLAFVAGKSVAASSWTCVEALSAFAMKARMGVLTKEQAESAASAMWADVASSYQLCPVTNEDLLDAGRYLLPGSPALRAGDALHLAIAMRLKAEIVSLDAELLAAAAHAGLTVCAP